MCTYFQPYSCFLGTLMNQAHSTFFAILLLGTSSAFAAPESLTPIKHVIVIVGENRTFDNVFGGYRPKKGQSVSNLLSRGIIKADGTPGPNFGDAAQRTAESRGAFSATPTITGTYDRLPQPYAAGAFGQRQDVPDARFPPTMQNGPFQISHHVGYGTHTGDPTHRFFQMWQQTNGGKHDLFTWVAQTAGPGPSNASTRLAPGKTFQGGIAMGFYNMSTGDAPYLKYLADTYALADNYHQPIMGGTAANYLALATADVAFYTVDGKPGTPPQKQIENPDAQAGTNNWYTEDGYRGGSYVRCDKLDAPGVAGIRDVLQKLPYRTFNDGNCAADTYYMVNNLEPAYSATGALLAFDEGKFILPPLTIPHIGDALTAGAVSWKWYSGGRNDGIAVDKEYCGMCDTPTFFTSTMTGPDRHKLQDLQQFYIDVKSAKTLPAVSMIAPYDSISGHPGYAAETSFDELVQDIVKRVQSNRALWNETAIFVIFDEGGGFYDSGYIQILDFFGDGTRMPMLAISPYTKGGRIDHTYYNHASISKFIERNWKLPPLSTRSRDNLPNPINDPHNPYVPANRPAIGDLMNMFDFSSVNATKATSALH